jgi:hypothetical protein
MKYVLNIVIERNDMRLSRAAVERGAAVVPLPLRMLLPDLSSFVARVLRRLAWLAAILCASWLLLTGAFEWYRSGVCYREVLANVSNVSGFNFQIFAEDCWHSLETGVFVSKSGRSGKTLLFLYDTLEVPTITSLDDHTIQVGLGDIGSIYCRNDKWEDFTIKYDIRSVRYPRPELRACQ